MKYFAIILCLGLLACDDAEKETGQTCEEIFDIYECLDSCQTNDSYELATIDCADCESDCYMIADSRCTENAIPSEPGYYDPMNSVWFGGFVGCVNMGGSNAECYAEHVEPALEDLPDGFPWPTCMGELGEYYD